MELIPGRAWREEAIEAELGRRGDGLQSTTTWSVLPLLWLDLYLTKSAVTRTPGRARREEAIEAELEQGGRRAARARSDRARPQVAKGVVLVCLTLVVRIPNCLPSSRIDDVAI